VKLIAKGRAARRLGVAGVIGASGEDLAAGRAGWVRVRVRGPMGKRLEGFDRSAKPRIVVSARGWVR
jgi:hypothetical protein